MLAERGQLQRHRVTEEQRSRRLLAWLAAGLLLGAAAILAFAPQATNVYLGAAFLLVAAGAFGIKSFRIKVKDFELDAGSAGAERR
jgi:predicted Zn-dependent protease